MIVTIDGPAGAGKSTAAQALAERIDFRYLDTGAMYRAVTLAALRQGVPLDAAARLEQFAQSLDIRLSGRSVLLNQEEVTEAIRDQAVTRASRYVADSPAIR